MKSIEGFGIVEFSLLTVAAQAIITPLALWLKNKGDRKEREARQEQEKIERLAIEAERDKKLAELAKLSEKTFNLSNGNMGAQLAITRVSMKATYDASVELFDADHSPEKKARMEVALAAWHEAERLFKNHEANEIALRKAKPDPVAEMDGKLLPYGYTNVVIIDDSIEDTELIKDAMRRNGFPQKVRTFSDGQEALDFLMRREVYKDYPPISNIQLILLDYNLLKLSGAEVLKQIKEDSVLKMMPVVVLTGSNSPAEIANVYRLGANGLVQKPTGAEEFFESVSAIMVYFLKVNQLHPARS